MHLGHAALQQAAAQGNPDEEDLFIARGVLQLLATGKANVLDEKLVDAHDVLQSYEDIDDTHALPKTPLMNFLHFLIKVLPIQKHVCKHMLTYASALQDISIQPVVEQIDHNL